MRTAAQSGMTPSSMPNSGITIANVMATVINMPRMLRPNPLLTICGIVTYPEPKTIAFGGVATGNMKAQDAAIAAGTISKSGFCPKPIAIAESIGITIAEVAVLEVSSVRKMMRVATAKTRTKIGAVSSRPT